MKLIASPALDPRKLRLRGGRLCLDFVNTVDPRAGEENWDFLATYDHLTAWAAHAGAVTEEKSEDLRREAAAHPWEAARALLRATELREAAYRILVAVSHGRTPAPADLATLNAALADAMEHVRVVSEAEGFAWGWDAESRDLSRVLWPVARSVADLLTSEELGRVRACAGEACGWVFLDASKNRSRRWCAMGVCGNRAKAKRHYARVRRRSAAGP